MVLSKIELQHKLLKDAIKNKKVKPGGTIIEGTAGNTGIGIALVANALSLKSIIVVPNNQSQEKIDTLKACGAEVVLVPPVPGKNQIISLKLHQELLMK